MSIGRSRRIQSTNAGGNRSAYGSSRSRNVGSVSGSGASGIGYWCSGPGSATWNDADRLKIARPCWIATTRRVVKLRPSRMRSTSKMIGMRGSPGRRKYACSECTWPRSTVRPAATERLPRDLPAEHPLAVLVGAQPAEQVHLELLELEQVDQIVERRAHGA